MLLLDIHHPLTRLAAGKNINGIEALTRMMLVAVILSDSLNQSEVMRGVPAALRTPPIPLTTMQV